MWGRWDVVDPLLNRLLRRCLELVAVSPAVEVCEGEVFMVMAERRSDAGEEVEEDGVFGALMGRGGDEGCGEDERRCEKGYGNGDDKKGYRDGDKKGYRGDDEKGYKDNNEKEYTDNTSKKEASANQRRRRRPVAPQEPLPQASVSQNKTSRSNDSSKDTRDQPISNYLPFALQRIRLASRLWKLPLRERKRRVAECLEIPQETMDAPRELLFQKCVQALAKHILSEVIEEEARGSVWLYMAIAQSVLEGKTRYVKVRYTDIAVKERKHLFLTYEAVSMAVRLAFSPFSILHLDVNDMFIKVGLGSCDEGKRVEFRRFLQEYYRLTCLSVCFIAFICSWISFISIWIMNVRTVRNTLS